MHLLLNIFRIYSQYFTASRFIIRPTQLGYNCDFKYNNYTVFFIDFLRLISERIMFTYFVAWP